MSAAHDLMTVYVSTYASYNSGSLRGAWVDLEQFSSKEEFLEHCRDMFPDEGDPELMFQDWQGIPEGFVSESSIEEIVWDFLRLSNDEQECIRLYLDEVNGEERDLDRILECYIGAFESESDWAYQWWEESGMLGNVPGYAHAYIDFESYARDARLNGDVVFVRHEGRLTCFNGNY